jgi:lactoylglutathione lyase
MSSIAQERWRTRMKTLHTAYRVTDVEMSLAFYRVLGYQVVGRVELGEGASLTVLKFPCEPVGTLELVHRPADGVVLLGTGFSHLVVQVEDLADTRQRLRGAGLAPEPSQTRVDHMVRPSRG